MISESVSQYQPLLTGKSSAQKYSIRPDSGQDKIPSYEALVVRRAKVNACGV